MATSAPGLGSALDARVDGIGHLLRDRLMAVPPYQRSYSWTKEQIEQYVADLQSAMGGLEPAYFMGTVVLTPGREGRLTVIDGQQRLATTVMLFSAICQEFADAGEVSRAQIVQSDYVASLDLRTNESRSRLILNIDDRDVFEAVTLRQPVTAERESHRRIVAAYDQLRSAVEAEVERAGPHWQDALFRWVSFIDSQVQVIAVVADNEADAFLLFETLNDRGMDLTVVDLLKNHLFGLARNAIERVQQPWIAAIETLDSEEDQTMTTFLRHHWSSINGVTRERELYRSLKRYVRAEEQAAEFAEGLQASAYHYAALLDASHDYWRTFDPDVREAVAVLLSFGLEQNRPLLLAAMDMFSADELGRLFHALVAWTVRGLIVGGIGAGTTEAAYSNAAVSIRRGWVTSTADVLDAIRPVVPDDTDFVAAFSTRSMYRVRTGAYLLLAVERFRNGLPRPAFPSPQDRDAHVVDAVLPRNADPQEWPGWTSATISAYSRRLGNFVLLPAGDRLPGRTWDQRKAGLDYAVETTGDLASEQEWLPELIAQRQATLAAEAPNIWPWSY
jgi:hypothetical protein